MNNIKILYFDRIYVSEGTDVNKTSRSKECDICHYWYFLNKGFKFQPFVSNRCHDLLITFMNLSHIGVLRIQNANYCCIITEINKREAKKLLHNVDLNENFGTL